MSVCSRFSRNKNKDFKLKTTTSHLTFIVSKCTIYTVNYIQRSHLKMRLLIFFIDVVNLLYVIKLINLKSNNTY